MLEIEFINPSYKYSLRKVNLDLTIHNYDRV